NYFDRVDPINIDGLIILHPPAQRSAKNIFMTLGTNDTFSPASTLVQNAAALSVAKTTPVLLDFDTLAPMATRPVSQNFQGVFAAALQYMRGSYDGHFVAEQNASAIKDWTAFVTSFFATGTPVVP